ncbi:hypothetical protein IFM89_003827 [Coptis chinensis]|uniref:Reverse transcriptase zinc-binding domain-containing protein n=1 Tax=Coptis chinensis TaxID=261450 RepID=A0A835IVZ6_9MAGN|nr:hypothetical protein IFM89_003827 [Coptis chinensis]
MNLATCNEKRDTQVTFNSDFVPLLELVVLCILSPISTKNIGPCSSRIGDGRRIDFWKDPWVPINKVMAPDELEDNRFEGIYTVQDAMIDFGEWNGDILNQLQPPLRAAIKNIHLRPSPQDKLIWLGNKKGIFYTKSAYHFSTGGCKGWNEPASGQTSDQTWNKNLTALWKLPIPARVQLFTWKILKNIIPTTDNLH